MNDLLRPSLYDAYHEIIPVRSSAEDSQETVDVVGPVCETGDFFARDRRLPIAQEGDLLAVLDAGAYGMVLASNYNTRPRAAEVLVSGKSVKVIRRRETIADLLRERGLIPGRILFLSVQIPHYFPAHDRLQHFHFANLGRINGKNVIAQQHHIRQFARRDRSLFFLLKLSIRRAHGVGLNRFLDREFLLREPTIGILSIQRRAGHRCIDREAGIQWRDVPIRPESQMHTMIQKGAKRIGPAGAVMADACFRPAPIIDGVIRLN